MQEVKVYPVRSILDISRVKAKVSVPEKEIINDQARAYRPYRDTCLGGHKVYEAKLSERNIVSSPITRTYEVKFTLDNPDQALLPGMVCNLSLASNTSGATSIIVPNSAVHTSDKGKFVWVVKDGKADIQAISVGNLSPNGVHILSGLAQGSRVVIEGTNKLSRGTKVTE